MSKARELIERFQGLPAHKPAPHTPPPPTTAQHKTPTVPKPSKPTGEHQPEKFTDEHHLNKAGFKPVGVTPHGNGLQTSHYQHSEHRNMRVDVHHNGSSVHKAVNKVHIGDELHPTHSSNTVEGAVKHYQNNKYHYNPQK